jgi:hypothetical protein
MGVALYGEPPYQAHQQLILKHSSYHTRLINYSARSGSAVQHTKFSRVLSISTLDLQPTAVLLLVLNLILVYTLYRGLR